MKVALTVYEMDNCIYEAECLWVIWDANQTNTRHTLGSHVSIQCVYVVNECCSMRRDPCGFGNPRQKLSV